VVTEELAKVDGVDNVIIFGSWAARYLGTPGFAPNDLDLLILGKPNSHQIAKANIAIQNRIDRVVNSMSRPTSWWTNTSKDPLKKEIKRRPFIII
jgi:predicted nucleotidyltransferase